MPGHRPVETHSIDCSTRRRKRITAAAISVRWKRRRPPTMTNRWIDLGGRTWRAIRRASIRPPKSRRRLPIDFGQIGRRFQIEGLACPNQILKNILPALHRCEVRNLVVTEQDAFGPFPIPE